MSKVLMVANCAAIAEAAEVSPCSSVSVESLAALMEDAYHGTVATSRYPKVEKTRQVASRVGGMGFLDPSPNIQRRLTIRKVLGLKNEEKPTLH